MPDYLDSGEFLHGFNEGNDVAFNALYQRYFDKIFGFCRGFVMQSDVAEDVATETFLKLYHARGRFISHASIRSFLYVAGRNLCIDHLRKAKLTEKAMKAAGVATELSYMQVNDELDVLYLEVVKQAIDKLPPRQKEVIEKLYVEEIGYKTAAEEMELSIESLYSLRSRAVSLLREIIKSHPLSTELSLVGLYILLFF